MSVDDVGSWRDMVNRVKHPDKDENLWGYSTATSYRYLRYGRCELRRIPRLSKPGLSSECRSRLISGERRTLLDTILRVDRDRDTLSLMDLLCRRSTRSDNRNYVGEVMIPPKRPRHRIRLFERFHSLRIRLLSVLRYRL